MTAPTTEPLDGGAWVQGPGGVRRWVTDHPTPAELAQLDAVHAQVRAEQAAMRTRRTRRTELLAERAHLRRRLAAVDCDLMALEP